MADAVTTTTLFSGRRRKVYNFTNISDGTGESAVTKVTLSSLTFNDMIQIPTYSVIDLIDFEIQGFASVRLHWAHTTPDLIAALPAGVGSIYWNAVGGNVDPRSAGGTGNITLTTNGGSSGSTYNITLYLRPKN